MPVVTIPFDLPTAFDLPPFMASELREAGFASASQLALDILAQMDASDATFVATRDPAGRWHAGAFAARFATGHTAMAAFGEELEAADQGAAANFLETALASGRAALMMGEANTEEEGPLSPAWRNYLCGEQVKGPVGFLYVVPLANPASGLQGALVLHRQMASGALNHDQPAITAALARVLGERIAAEEEKPPVQHAPGFLAIVDEARPRIHETSVAEVVAKLAAGQAFTLIDVREDDEWRQGHVQGAIHLGRGVIERDIEGRVPDKQAPLVLYCGGGFRSILAADNLQKMGYTDVRSMAGGWRGWRAGGGPVETPSA